ncbi:exosome complex component RRP41 homolog [Castanea sativa]|uniref:exosome complex component RRP41 homolog n=1 Tax=Castanea sativa TaxID=21020 RepID=UPI003F650248
MNSQWPKREETIDRDIFGNLPDHGSLHIDTFDASVSDRYFCPSTPSRCGARSACINAATLALVDAGIPMRDLVTSCIPGYLNITPLLDLNYVEDSAGGPDVTGGFLPKLDKVTLLQMDSKLPIDTSENVMQLAIEGCKAIANYIREIMLENTKQLEYRRGI